MQIFTESRRSTLFIVQTLAFTLLAWALSGCATGPNANLVNVSLVQVQQVPSTSGGLGDLQLACTLRIDNASPVSLPLTGSAHDITINGLRLGQARSDQPVVVPRLGSETVTVNLNLNAIRMTQAVYQMYQDQNFQYQVLSTLYPGSKDTLQGRGFQVETAGTLEPSQFQLMSTLESLRRLF